MRDPQVIASEIDRARRDLDASLGALKALVRDKLDVKQRARHAIERRVRGAGEAVRRHAAITAVVVCAVIALVYVWARQRHR